MNSHRRSFSPTSANTTITNFSAPRIVTKLSLEGKAKNNGANVKLYLKLSVPVDQVSPGQPVPLFPEDSLKIVDSAVQPLDSQNVPYSFSSSMLLQASRSLGLPNRSSKSYISLFPHISPGRAIDERLTGHISVVDYQVSYILPKEFPPQYPSPSSSSAEREGPAYIRGSAIMDRNVLQFMAAIDMVLPFHSVPPRAPYMLSIPIPKCLSNSVKLQIIPPSPARWDVSTTPSISARPPSSPKSVSSSVSSMNFEVDDLVINGSFPSSSKFVVRFALPDPGATHHSQGRSKVGVSNVSAITQWRVLERRENKVKASVACELKVRGVWHAGVATLLGMDVALQSLDTRVEWAEGGKRAWDIHGSLGYTGYSAEAAASRQSVSATEKTDSPTRLPNSRPPSTSSLSSAGSLLRAPLPQPTDIPDFSFENHSPASSHLSTPSSSLTAPTNTTSRSMSAIATNGDDSPCSGLVYHINMSDLGPSEKNTMDFEVYGDVTLHADEDGKIILPSFLVKAASEQRGEVLLQSDIDNLQWLSDRAREPVFLKKGVTQRCVEATTLLLRNSSVVPPAESPDLTGTPRIDSLTPLQLPQRNLTADAPLSDHFLSRPTTLFIPRVHAVVIPLLSRTSAPSCAIRIRIPCPPISHRNLEFGLVTDAAIDNPPSIQLVSSTIGSRTVEPQLLPGSARAGSPPSPESGVMGKEWVCWVTVNLSSEGTSTDHTTLGDVEVVYLVSTTQSSVSPAATFETRIVPLLPCFAAKVGCFDVDVEECYDWDVLVENTNFSYRRAPTRLSSFTLDSYFFPLLSLSLKERRSTRRITERWLERLLLVLLGALLFAMASQTTTVLDHLPLSASMRRNVNRPSVSVVPTWTQSARMHSTSTVSPVYSPKQPTMTTTRSSQNDLSKPRETAADIRVRMNALATLAAMHANRIYNQETKWILMGFHQGLSDAWRLCVRLWHWPLPAEGE